MATLLRKRRLANPAKRRVKKRMSAKQIKFFGTKRQKSALKNSAGRRKVKKYKREATVKRSSKYLKAKFKARKNPTRRRRLKNVGKIVTLGRRSNPGKGRKRRVIKGMAKVHRRKRRSNPTAKKVVRRKRRSVSAPVRRRRRSRKAVSNPRRRRSYARRNPGKRVGASRRRYARRNPGMGSEWKGMIEDSLAVIGGAIGTKYVTQLVLGGNNTSYIGYLGNAIAAGVLGYGVNKFLKNKRMGHMIMLGGFTALALRVLQDQTPLGQYVNLSLNGLGKAGDIGIGAIEDSSFATPVTWPAGKMSGMAQVPTYLQAAIPAATIAPGMKGLGSVNRNSRRTRGRL